MLLRLVMVRRVRIGHSKLVQAAEVGFVFVREMSSGVGRFHPHDFKHLLSFKELISADVS